MANLTSFRGYQNRYRDWSEAADARATPRITCTAQGLPCLDIEIKGEERIFRLILSPEETDTVTRMIYRSLAHGMNQLRAKYEPVEG